MPPPPNYHTALEKKVEQHDFQIKSVIDAAQSASGEVEKLADAYDKVKDDHGGRIRALEVKCDSAHEKHGELNKKHDQLDQRIFTFLIRLVAILVTVILALAGVIIKLVFDKKAGG